MGIVKSLIIGIVLMLGAAFAVHASIIMPLQMMYRPDPMIYIQEQHQIEQERPSSMLFKRLEMKLKAQKALRTSA